MTAITPGMEGKTKHGTPVEILKEIEPFRYNGKSELRRVEVIFFGRHTGQLVIDMNLNNIIFEEKEGLKRWTI